MINIKPIDYTILHLCKCIEDGSKYQVVVAKKGKALTQKIRGRAGGGKANDVEIIFDVTRMASISNKHIRGTAEVRRF